MATILVTVAALAQQAPTPAQVRQLEAARLWDAKAQEMNVLPAGWNALTDAQRVAAWALDIEKTGRIFEQRHEPMPLQQDQEVRLRIEQQRAEQREIIANPAAFAKEDAVSLGASPMVAQAKLRASEHAEKYFEDLLRAFAAALSAGRTVTDVGLSSVAAARRTELLSRLPVRPGDLLSFSSVEDLATAVKGFDPNLDVRILLVENGGVAITISAPENANQR
jgi:hypothetical protein